MSQRTPHNLEDVTGPEFVEGRVQVTVPATSANLGPGFDSLGLALAMRDSLSAEVLDTGLVVEIVGEGSGELPLDERHLVVRAMRSAFDLLGGQPPGLRLTCHNVIPHGRGLGSSSAALVGGVCLARALVRDGTERLDDGAIFQLVAQMEGHPDNVAPALFGGFCINGEQDGQFYSVRGQVHNSITTVVFVPHDPVLTELARRLLPATVPHAEAAANSGRAALLVAALANQPELLLKGTRDYLHQDYRKEAMAASHDFVTLLRDSGVAAVISGAGPTVLCFTTGSQVSDLMARCPAGWSVHHLDIEEGGVVIE